MTRNFNVQKLHMCQTLFQYWRKSCVVVSSREEILVTVTKLLRHVQICVLRFFDSHIFVIPCTMTHRFSPLRLPLVDRVIVGHSWPHCVCVPLFVCLHGM